MDGYKFIQTEDLEPGIRRIALNRPDKRNALSNALRAELFDALRKADADASIGAIILRGNGKCFSAGYDLAQSPREPLPRQVSPGEGVWPRHLVDGWFEMWDMATPILAQVHGYCLAGGSELATACDLVLAERSAQFGYPEVKIGFVPAMVMAILRRNVSEKRAFELLTLGAEIGAEEALELGLVNRVFDDETFADEVRAFVRRFQKVSRSAVSLSKRLLYQIDGLDFEGALQCGSDTNVIGRMTQDCKKGLERFLTKE